MVKKHPASHKKRYFGPLIAIALILSAYGIFRLTKTTHEDPYVVIFAWTAFAIIWAIIAILRYENLQGKC